MGAMSNSSRNIKLTLVYHGILENVMVAQALLLCGNHFCAVPYTADPERVQNVLIVGFPFFLPPLPASPHTLPLSYIL